MRGLLSEVGSVEMVDWVGRKRGGDDLKNGFIFVFMVEGSRFIRNLAEMGVL